MDRLTKKTLLRDAERRGIQMPENSTKAMIIRAIEEDEAEQRRRILILQAERRRKDQEALDLHRQTRTTEMRRQRITVEEGLKKLDYPLSNLDEYGGTARIFQPIPTEASITDANLSGFPTQIREFLWVHEGINDDEPWLALGILENGTFFFYKGECDYTGFDCQGDMKLYGSSTLATLIDSAMGITDYDMWVRETNSISTSE